MRPGPNGIDLTGWAAPRYKPITRCRVEEHARLKLLYLIDLLEQRGDSPEEMEQTVGSFRERSIAGLNYHTELLEEELGIEKEEQVQRVKRTKRVKEKRPKRGGLFG